MSKPNDFWSSPTGFILATIGAAIGLGSIWKFPYEVGANGGGAFVLFYLVGVALIVFPLMLVEFAIGRRGRADAAYAIANVATDVGASRLWALCGLLGVAAAFIILSFYSVIGGWAIAYAVDTTLQALLRRMRARRRSASTHFGGAAEDGRLSFHIHGGGRLHCGAWDIARHRGSMQDTYAYPDRTDNRPRPVFDDARGCSGDTAVSVPARSGAPYIAGGA